MANEQLVKAVKVSCKSTMLASLSHSTAVDVFKRPIKPVRKSRSIRILSEECYVEKISDIIERDFFPDLRRLKEAKTKETTNVTNTPHSQREPSPATFETPARTTNDNNSALGVISLATKSPKNSCNVTDQPPPNLTLDQFLATHTSQDNESFGALIEADEVRHNQKFAHLYEEEERCAEEAKQRLALPDAARQCIEAPRPFNVDTWQYKNWNSVMFTPDEDHTPESKGRNCANGQQIAHQNTRLDGNPFNTQISQKSIKQIARQASQQLDGKIGVDGKELLTSDTPKIGGYSLVRSRTPAPDTPLMTWGQIEGTPCPLIGSQTPGGPAFRMNEPARREVLAHQLADEAQKRNRERSMTPLLRSPLLRTGSALKRFQAMSPAARKLRRELQNSPRIATTRPMTPKSMSLGIKRTPQTPTVNARHVVDAAHLTDDLLNIELAKRQKAVDFF